MDVRYARLKGAKEAHRLLMKIEARDRIDRTDGRIDVFAALADLGIPVLFKPLDGLLGAYLREPAPGVLISTNRPYSVQRFTAAHELGHAVMQHEPSLDSLGVLRRAAEGLPPHRYVASGGHLQEIEADSFAGELLVPRWLIVRHAKTQGWNLGQLAEPTIAYQLSLRCGCSYEATVRSLERNSFIRRNESRTALATAPKKIKKAVCGTTELTTPRADTWCVSERDASSTIPVAVGDLLRINMKHEGGRSPWRLEVGFAPELASRTADGSEADSIGRNSTFLTAAVRGCAKISLSGSDPTEGDRSMVEISVRVQAPESGLSQAHRAKFFTP